ncbi:MAG: ribosomal-processing cysteine protease Prp [bacterium]|nr:ribosomal-processing cysteine protease Prp [bacterium]
MTTMIIRKNSSDHYDSFTCMGHAGYARFPKQKDIVCAAVSMLVINTVNSLEKLAQEQMDVKTNEVTGFIDCRFMSEISDQGKLLMDSMVLGFQGIEQQYGNKYLELKFEEV